MKKLIVLSLVVIMLAASVVPALAAGGPSTNHGSASSNCYGSQAGYSKQNSFGSQVGYGSQTTYGTRTPYALSGTITAVDRINHTASVEIACGNRLTDPYIGQTVTLAITDSTRLLQRNESSSATPITIDQLAEGQSISSHGTLVDGVWTATRITTGALLNCLP